MDNTVGTMRSLYLGVNNRAVRSLRNSLTLSDKQKSLIYGTMLGDGSIIGNSAQEQKNYRLNINHSVKQKDLVFWKYEILKKFVLSPPSYRPENNSWRFRTISHPEITEIYNLFYRAGKKILPENIQEILKDNLALAVWFMDDGGVGRYKNKVQRYYLNTQSFSYRENVELARLFKREIGLRCGVLKNKGKYRLHFGPESRDGFKELVKIYVIPSLEYKLM